MQDFLLNNFSLILHSVEIFAAIIGLFCLKKYKGTIVTYFIYFLVYVALLELFGAYPTYVKNFEFLSGVKEFLKGTRFEKNHWWYLIFWTIGSTVFYSVYFGQLINSQILKKIIKYLLILFIVFNVVYFANNWEAIFESLPIVVRILNIGIVLLSIVFYLIKIIQSDKLLKFYESLNFYIASTVLIWVLIFTPLIFFDDYFSTKDMAYVKLKATIILFCNIFMYITFSFALIWCKPQNN